MRSPRLKITRPPVTHLYDMVNVRRSGWSWLRLHRNVSQQNHTSTATWPRGTFEYGLPVQFGPRAETHTGHIWCSTLYARPVHVGPAYISYETSCPIGHMCATAENDMILKQLLAFKQSGTNSSPEIPVHFCLCLFLNSSQSSSTSSQWLLLVFECFSASGHDLRRRVPLVAKLEMFD